MWMHQEIKQVVLNLIVNALESMDANGTLRIEARYSQGMAEMVFTDNGCGMSPEVLENIFEPFFTKRRDGKGTGLGLSITHRIVNQHHGEIMASSRGRKSGLDLHRAAADPSDRDRRRRSRLDRRAGTAVAPDGRGSDRLEVQSAIANQSVDSSRPKPATAQEGT